MLGVLEAGSLKYSNLIKIRPEEVSAFKESSQGAIRLLVLKCTYWDSRLTCFTYVTNCALICNKNRDFKDIRTSFGAEVTDFDLIDYTLSPEKPLAPASPGRPTSP